MSFESVTIAALSGSAAVTTIVPATRIWFGSARQGVDQPFIVCTKIFTTPTLSTDNGQAGASRLDNVHLRVTAYARTYAAANTLASAIRGALERAAPTVFILEDQRDDFDDLPDLFGQILAFSCWHPDNSPA